MSIILKQMEDVNIAPEDDAMLYHHFEPRSGVLDGCAVSKAGNKILRVADGSGLMCGRLYKVAQMDVDAVIAQSGTVYGRLKIVIDKERTSGMITIETEVATSAGELPGLVQEDINADGTVFEIELARYTANDAEISDVQDTREIVQETIDGSRIANGAVTAGKIADGAVTASKIESGAVTAAKIGAKAVTRAKIGDAAVGEDQIGAGAVTKTKLSQGIQTSLDLADSALQAVPDTYRTADEQDEIDEARRTVTTVTLIAENWEDGKQTVAATGVTAGNLIFVSPTPQKLKAYSEAGVYCSAQASGTLTFDCDSVPIVDITVNVTIFN